MIKVDNHCVCVCKSNLRFIAFQSRGTTVITAPISKLLCWHIFIVSKQFIMLRLFTVLILSQKNGHIICCTVCSLPHPGSGTRAMPRSHLSLFTLPTAATLSFFGVKMRRFVSSLLRLRLRVILLRLRIVLLLLLCSAHQFTCLSTVALL